MDNSVSIVTPPQFVVNVVQVTGGTAGFSVLAGSTNFVVKVMASVGGGGSMSDAEVKTAYENNADTNEFSDAEQTKLAGIMAGATDDLTGAEIKVLYELEADTNAFDDAEQSKLAGIASGADVSPTPLTNAQIKTQYELNADTNVFNDLAEAKLGDIEADATADQTGAEIKSAYQGETNAFTDAQFTKLAGIATGADVSPTPLSNAQIKTQYELNANTNVHTDAQVSKLAAIEASATADQTDGEIETAYNAQVAKISGPEITAGTEATVRRVSPADLKAIVLAHETGGSGEPNPDQVSSQEIIDGTETALRSFSPDDIEAMAVLHGGGGGGMSDAEVKIAYENNPDTNEFDDAEQTKLAGIETGATTDQTNAEIRTAVEAASDSNVFTNADHTKLDAIEASATADQTGAEIKTAYQAETNAYTDAKDTKLTGIETAAKDDQTDAEIATAYGNQVPKVSGGEITAGTETALRTNSPADIVSFIGAHGASGGDPAGGGLINLQIITASGTYTPTPGAKKMRVTCIAAGGGGAGVKSTNSTYETAGGGGGSGGYAVSLISDAQSQLGAAITVGAAGVGGVNGTTNATDGGDTSFAALVVTTGGIGGISVGHNGSGGGSDGGTATAGDIQQDGSPGNGGLTTAGNNARGGHGGHAYMGAGGIGGFAFGGSSVDNNTGNPSLTYGGGGGAAASVNSTTTAPGGDGGAGLVIIEEYGTIGGGGGALIGMQVFDAAGGSTYTPTAGAIKARVFVTGGGGGGGGVDTNGGDDEAGGGGQAGATAISLVDVSDIAGLTITVGAAGAAGAAAATPAGNGGESSVGTVVTAAGGEGGGGVTSTVSWPRIQPQTIVGNIEMKGGDGDASGPIISGGNRMGGRGGASYWGGDTLSGLIETGGGTNGAPGNSYGSGGSGAVSHNNGAPFTGGAGAAGIVIIEEYGILQTEINEDTTTEKTLALVDAQAIVEMNNAAVNILLIPTNDAVAFPIGTVISVTALGAGVTSIVADTNVTLNGVIRGGGDIDAQYDGVKLYKRGVDEWVVQGAIPTIDWWSYLRSKSGELPVLAMNYKNNLYALDTGSGLVNKTFLELHTFSRASLATQFDVDGVLKFAPHNYQKRSNDFSDAIWVKDRLTITLNATVAPDGTTTATEFKEDTTATSSHRVRDGLLREGSKPYAVSIYVKAGVGSRHMYIRVTNVNSQVRYAYIDPVTGIIGTVESGLTATSENAGNGWFLFSVKFDAYIPGASDNIFGFADVDDSNIYTGDGTSTMFLWEAQSNRWPMAPARDTFAPHLVHTDASVVYQHRLEGIGGLRIEDQGTNVCLQSEDLDTTWVPHTTTLTDGQADPNGGITAFDVAHTNSVSIGMRQSITVTADVEYTISAYVRQGITGAHDWVRFAWVDDSANANGIQCWFDISGAGAVGASGIQLDGTGGVATSASIVNVGGGWFRIIITGKIDTTQTDAQVWLRNAIADDSNTEEDTNSVVWWGIQVEVGSIATSYIPTTTVAVTRLAEVVTFDIADFDHNAVENSVLVDFNTLAQTFTLFGSSGTVADSMLCTEALLHMESTTNRSKGSIGLANRRKIAAGVDATGMDFSVDGIAVVTSVDTFSAGTAATIQLGKSDSGDYLNGLLETFGIYNTHLSAPDLEGLAS